MNFSKREEDLLRRALDKATTDSEAKTAAKNLVKELRKRGVDGYEFVKPSPPPPPPPPPQWTPPPNPFAEKEPQWTPRPRNRNRNGRRRRRRPLLPGAIRRSFSY